MTRYIESALRIKWRLLLVALLVFLAAFAFLYKSKQGIYTSSARVWVDRPIYTPNDPGTNVYVTPASTQAGVFDELLRTHQFTMNIARKAGVPMPNVAAEDLVVTDIQKNLLVEAEGAHLIRVSYTSNKPTFVKAIITQAIQSFSDETNSNRKAQAQEALSFYDQQRSDYQQELNKSKDALAEYIRQHPQVNLPGAPLDPTYTQLSQQYNTDQTKLDEINSKIDQIKIQANSMTGLSNTIFQVRDDAQDAEPYQITSKDLIRNGFIALGLGIFAIIALTLVATWTDQALYTLNDVSLVPVLSDGPTSADMLVGVVPYVKSLASMRRQITKHESAARPASSRRRGKPHVSVVDDDTAKPATSEPAVRQLDVAADRIGGRGGQ